MESIVTRSTSSFSAVASDIVLREGKNIRLLFRPLIIENPNNPNECVKGTFIYQKRESGEPWQDYKDGSIKNLKPGEGISLEIKSSELLQFCKSVFATYKLAKQHGVLYGTNEFVLTNSNFSGVIRQILDNPDYVSQIVNSNGMDFLNQSLKWLSENIKDEETLRKVQLLNPESINHIDSALTISKIKSALQFWETSLDNDDENYWQSTFESNPWILSQVLPYPVILYRGKAYVGGKTIDNSNGNIVDFLYKNKMTENSVLIEIKTPMKKLLGPAYRGNSYSLSSELSGGVNQLLSYRDSLMRDSAHLLRMAGEDLRVYYPKCVLLLGCFRKEIDDQIKSAVFENFRSQMSNLEIITFDEIIDRTKNLLKMLGVSEK